MSSRVFSHVSEHVLLLQGWLGEEASSFFERLKAETPWESETLTLFGRKVTAPRLISWHGDAGTAYGYSGVRHEPKPWTPALRQLKARVEKAAGVRFNSALLNLYRDGRDGMGWHADDEPELGPRPVIASLSLGATRRFQLRRKDGTETLDYELASGDLLLMKGDSQRLWRHRVPKTAKKVLPRINVTFRRIKKLESQR